MNRHKAGRKTKKDLLTSPNPGQPKRLSNSTYMGVSHIHVKTAYTCMLLRRTSFSSFNCMWSRSTDSTPERGGSLASNLLASIIAAGHGA